jgi:serine/threonine protein kinase
VDLSIIGGHSLSTFEQHDSSRFETFVNRKKNRTFFVNILNFIFSLKTLKKRNIYLLGRQLVIGDLGHVKDVGGNSRSSRSNQAFGTNNYLAPEAHELRRSNKIDIWSFGCIVYELFNLEKLFNLRNPDKLRTSILNFRVDTNFNVGKIKPLYVRVVKR